MSRGAIEIVDTTIRDGNQSLWGATGLTTRDVLEIGSTLDRVGYHAIDFTSGTHMAVAVRFHQEDPWDRLRRMSEATPHTKLSMIGTGMRWISWVPCGADVIGLSFRCAARNGLRRYQLADPSNDPERIRRVVALAKREGIEEVTVALTYSISPVHTHQYYIERLRELADCEQIDRFYLKDPGGLLTPEAVRELGPHFASAAEAVEGRVAELHSHCTIGLAPYVYVEGVHAGFRVVHTASGPLSRGTSQPEVENTVRNLVAGGFDCELDLEAQAEVAAHFSAIAQERGLPSGQPQEFDGAYYRHQMPGGMVTTTQRMLAEIRRPELFDQVLEEVTRVRAEMGYPIIVTPVSQFVATQATHNIVDGERWKTVGDETIRYFLGHFGDHPAPVDPDVADKVLSRPQARGLAVVEPTTLEGAHEKFGRGISDEELLLRLMMPAEQVDAMVAAREAKDPPAPAAASVRPRGRAAAEPSGPNGSGPSAEDTAPLVALVRGLAERPQCAEATVTAGDETVVWRRGR